MSTFPETLVVGQLLSRELVKEIERRYNTHASLEAALLQAQNAAVDLAKQLATSEDVAEELRTKNFMLFGQIYNLQAKLDALMLEYCPDEMTPEQIAEWGRNQKAVIVPKGELK